MTFSLRIIFGATLVSIATLTGCEERAAPVDRRPSAPVVLQAPLSATGAIEGRIHFEGVPPVPARMPTNESVLRHCGAAVQDTSLTISEEGGVAFAVVSLDGVAAPSGEPPSSTLTVDQKGCLFLPATWGARAGATVVMKNSDPLTHNVRAQQSGRDLYNVAMPLTGMTIKKVLPPEPGVVRLLCDIHPWMNARIKTFDHPWFASTGAQGRFRLEAVPVGVRTVTAWHPRLGERSVTVDVSAGSVATAELRFSAADVRPLE